MVSPAPFLFGVQSSAQPVKVACFGCSGRLLLYRPSRGVRDRHLMNKSTAGVKKDGQRKQQVNCVALQLKMLCNMRRNSGGLIEYVTTMRSLNYTPHHPAPSIHPFPETLYGISQLLKDPARMSSP